LKLVMRLQITKHNCPPLACRERKTEMRAVNADCPDYPSLSRKLIGTTAYLISVLLQNEFSLSTQTVEMET